MVDVRRAPDPGASEIGQRVRMIRKRRGLSLDAAAGLAGISKPYLSHLETGKRNFNRRSLLENLAAALGCSVADFTGQPYLPTDRETTEAMSVVPDIRLALANYRPDDVPDVTPRPLAALTRWADEANRYRDETRFSLAGRGIGSLLTEAQAHAATATGEDRAAAFRALVTACTVAGVVAKNLGHIDLAVAAAHRGYDFARRAEDDPGLVGFARWYWALWLMRLAARRRAGEELTAGVDELTPAVMLGNTDATLPAEMAGLMHLTSAQAAAREQRGDEARAHLAEAATLAGRIGERNGMRRHFGPTNVAVWRVGIGVELDEGPSAAEAALNTPIDVGALDSVERSSSLHLDLARAWAQDGGPHDAEAVRHLDTADRIAPQRIRPDPIAHELLTTLSRRARRRVWELDSLRNRFGIR